MKAADELFGPFLAIDSRQTVEEPRILGCLLSQHLREANINRICEDRGEQVCHNHVQVTHVDLGLHIVVVEVIEHVTDFFKGLLVALHPPLPHDVCDLRDRVLQFGLMLDGGRAVVEAEDDAAEGEVPQHKREPPKLGSPRQLAQRLFIDLHLDQLLPSFEEDL